jgi:hypothetical protein
LHVTLHLIGITGKQPVGKLANWEMSFCYFELGGSTLRLRISLRLHELNELHFRLQRKYSNVSTWNQCKVIKSFDGPVCYSFGDVHIRVDHIRRTDYAH